MILRALRTSIRILEVNAIANLAKRHARVPFGHRRTSGVLAALAAFWF